MAFDHFEQNSYQRGRTDWNFNITFDNQPQIGDMAEQFADYIDSDNFYDPLPRKWLHSTILRAGFLEDFTDEEMAKTADIVSKKCASLELPEFIVGPWQLTNTAIEMQIAPGFAYRKLFEIVVTSLGEVCGESRLIRTVDFPFKAHFSLAYSKKHDNEIAVNERLQQAPKIQLPRFRATTLSMIKQIPTNGRYEWEVIRKIPIGQDKQ